MYIQGLVETRPLEKDLSSTYATREGWNMCCRKKLG